MAKKEKGSGYAFPSHFGSHKSMINEEATKTAPEGHVVCTDEFGDYITPTDRLDNGLADPCRSAQARLSKLFAKKEKDK